MYDWTNPDINDGSDSEAVALVTPVKKKTTSRQASKQPSILADEDFPTKLKQIPSKVARPIAAKSCQTRTPGDDGEFEATRAAQARRTCAYILDQRIRKYVDQSALSY